MLRKSGFCLVLFFALSMANFSAMAQSFPIELPASWEKGEAIQLFNGENLDHWYTFIKDRGETKIQKMYFRLQMDY